MWAAADRAHSRPAQWAERRARRHGLRRAGSRFSKRSSRFRVRILSSLPRPAACGHRARTAGRLSPPASSTAGLGRPPARPAAIEDPHGFLFAWIACAEIGRTPLRHRLELPSVGRAGGRQPVAPSGAPRPRSGGTARSRRASGAGATAPRRAGPHRRDLDVVGRQAGDPGHSAPDSRRRRSTARPIASSPIRPASAPSRRWLICSAIRSKSRISGSAAAANAFHGRGVAVLGDRRADLRVGEDPVARLRGRPPPRAGQRRGHRGQHRRADQARYPTDGTRRPRRRGRRQQEPAHEPDRQPAEVRRHVDPRHPQAEDHVVADERQRPAGHRPDPVRRHLGVPQGRKPSSAPKTPKIAPDAPAATTVGCTERLAIEPPTPESRYSPAKPMCPRSRSTTAPAFARQYMLKARCIQPKCRNMFENSRQVWPSRTVEGPKSAHPGEHHRVVGRQPGRVPPRRLGDHHRVDHHADRDDRRGDHRPHPRNRDRYRRASACTARLHSTPA